MCRKLVISCLIAVLAVPAGARTRPHYGGTLRAETAGDPLDRSGGMARRLIFDGLTDTGIDGALHPALAISWISESAAHRWRFRLRPGVEFHDGSPLTSIAVVASLMASCGNNCPWGNVRALGGSVLFTSESAMPNLPGILAGNEFLIADMQAPAPDGGTGPFQVAGQANGVVTLTACESCWQGRPFLDSIQIRTRRSIDDQWLDFSADRTDVVEVPADSIREAQQQHLALAVSTPVQILALQLGTSAALENENLRAAIADAVDRSVLANVVFQHQGIASGALLPQAISGFAFLFPAARDLNRARELRGGLTPPRLWLAAGAGATLQLAAQRIALDLREAGFTVQLAPSGSQSADMALRVFRLTGTNAADDLAEVVRASGQASPAFGPDAQSVYQAERAVLARKNLIPLVHLPIAYACGARVRDFHLRYDGSPDLASASLEASP